MSSKKEILEWYITSGVTETIGEHPINRFNKPEEKILLRKSILSPTTASIPEKQEQLPDNLLQTAISLAQSAQTLDELKEAVLNFNGCALKKTAKNTVFGEGSTNAPIMFVGEAPGADEDRLGRPFVGVSGQLLDKIMSSVGLSREKNVYITNIIPWRPPGNRNPSSSEISLCMPFIERHIELLHPKILVMIGGVSTSSLTGSSSGIMKMRGNWITYQTPNLNSPIPAIPILHTAFLLRNPIQKRLAWKDILSIRQKMDELGLN